MTMQAYKDLPYSKTRNFIIMSISVDWTLDFIQKSKEDCKSACPVQMVVDFENLSSWLSKKPLPAFFGQMDQHFTVLWGRRSH